MDAPAGAVRSVETARNGNRAPKNAPKAMRRGKRGPVPTKHAPEERVQFLDELARGRGRRSASVILRVAYRRVLRTIQEDEDFAAEVRAREGVFWESIRQDLVRGTDGHGFDHRAVR
jgi:hypothetical protein